MVPVSECRMENHQRGMDEVGYVTIIGTQFQSPEEVAELVLSGANPLESRFSPSYSMVLNLLQRFSLDEAKELILKSFGYFSSGSRLQPLLKAQEQIKEEIPLNRIGQSEDIAKCAKWLIEDKYTTGQIINVNGGWFI